MSTDYAAIFAKYPEDTSYAVIARAEGLNRNTLNEVALEQGFRKPRAPGRKTPSPTDRTDPFLKPLFDGRSDREIGRLSGVSQQVISEWRNGRHSPRMSVLLAVCRANGLTIEIVREGKLQRILDALEALRGTNVTGDFVCAELTDLLLDIMEGVPS